jgi:hypothetical protein
MKFINLLLKSTFSDINLVYKHDAETEVIRVYSFDLQPTYRSEKWLVPSDKIHVM